MGRYYRYYCKLSAKLQIAIAKLSYEYYFKIPNISGAVLKKMDKSVRKLSPDLLHALASMGHNDKIVLGDANFAAANYGAKCQGEPRPRLVRADGHKITDLLKGILKLLPLEKDVDM